jgi:hypothetical protein
LANVACKTAGDHFERRLAVKYKILVAHQSHPEDFRHEIDIDFIGTEWTEVAQEMVDLLNEDNFRDCIFKIDEPTAEDRGAPAVQPGNNDYTAALEKELMAYYLEDGALVGSDEIPALAERLNAVTNKLMVRGVFALSSVGGVQSPVRIE